MDYTKNYTKGIVNRKQYIVLHHTWNTALQGNLNVLMWVRPSTNPVSAHYLIDQTWLVHTIAPDGYVTRHAGTSYRDGKKGLNLFSIGIEILGPDETGQFTYEQKVAVKTLVRDLMKKYNIPQKNVIRHKDIAPGRKTDVADSFRYPKYKTRSEYQKSL